MQNCDVLVAVAVVVVEAPYVSDPESVTSLDNSFLPSSLQQPQHKKKLARRKNLLFTSAVFYFRALFYELRKAITHVENRIANTIEKSDSVCDQAIANYFRMFATFLRVYENQALQNKNRTVLPFTVVIDST